MSLPEMLIATNALIMSSMSDCTVSVVVSGVAVAEFRAIHHRPPKQSRFYIDGGVETSQPTLTVLQDNVGSIRPGVTLQVSPDMDPDGLFEYQLMGAPEPDGLGMCRLPLTEDF